MIIDNITNSGFLFSKSSSIRLNIPMNENIPTINTTTIRIVLGINQSH